MVLRILNINSHYFLDHQAILQLAIQNPDNSLVPTTKYESAIREYVKYHQKYSKKQLRVIKTWYCDALACTGCWNNRGSWIAIWVMCTVFIHANKACTHTHTHTSAHMSGDYLHENIVKFSNNIWIGIKRKKLKKNSFAYFLLIKNSP